MWEIQMIDKKFYILVHKLNLIWHLLMKRYSKLDHLMILKMINAWIFALQDKIKY